MNNTSILRVCVVLEWVLLITGVALSFALESNLPDSLRAWLAEEYAQDLTSFDLAIIAVGFVVVIATIVASVGLLFLQRWAAWLYLATTVIGCVFMMFTGPTVEHAVSYAFDDVSVVFTGLVLGLAFFTDALKPRENHVLSAGPLA
jgi:hypothetical protein